jgi:gliding motility-associated-like protein
MKMQKNFNRFFIITTIFLFSGMLVFSDTFGQELQLADTTLACFADSVLLDAGEGFQSYLWNTDEQTQTIYAKDTGWYYVWGTDENMELLMDSTWVYFHNASIFQNDTLVCYTEPVTLCVQPDNFVYKWYSNDPSLAIPYDTATCIEVVTENEATVIYVTITDSLGLLSCTDSVRIWLYPRMVFTEVNQIEMGCPGTCRGQLQVSVEGGLPPYSYLWTNVPPNQQFDTIAFNLCEIEYTFQVTDRYRCIRDTSILVEVFDMPEVEAYYDGPKGEKNEKIYLQNPVVIFKFDNNSAPDIEVIDWNWDFGDSTYSKEFEPRKVFDQLREFDVWLKYTTGDECIDSTTLKVDVGRIKLVIPNVITPNGDQYNQYFLIDSLEHYVSNEIKIYNRTGKQVFSRKDYQGDWDAENLREGVYFYVLKAEGYFGAERFQGTITVMR